MATTAGSSPPVPHVKISDIALWEVATSPLYTSEYKVQKDALLFSEVRVSTSGDQIATQNCELFASTPHAARAMTPGDKVSITVTSKLNASDA